MKVPIGKKAFGPGTGRVPATGMRYTAAELDTALTGRVKDIVNDTTGVQEVATTLAGFSETAFDDTAIRAVLESEVEIEDWRVGEALAEAYLTDHRDCLFPWPMGRDLRNPKASPAGTDLVGFQNPTAQSQFAFSEVKTSYDGACPPQVVTGPKGLTKQLCGIRDSKRTKDALIKYLAYRANNSAWAAPFRAAVKRYFADCRDVAVIGVLIRDVEPDAADLASCAQKLAEKCSPLTKAEVLGIYLPNPSIKGIAKRIATGGAS